MKTGAGLTLIEPPREGAPRDADKLGFPAAMPTA